MYEPGVDIIVVDYRTPDDLRRFLRSVPAALTIDSTGWAVACDQWVGLVDSMEDRSAAVPFVDAENIIFFLQNVGYGRAVNTLASVGKREVLAIFNADIELSPGAIGECYAALMSNDRWGALGPAQLDDRRRFVHGGIMGTNTAPVMRGWMEGDRGQHDDVRDDAVSVAGAAYFIKRQAWDEMAGCPTYEVIRGALSLAPSSETAGAFLATPFYYEETWCSYHLRAHGWQVVYYGPVRITHGFHQAVTKNEMQDWAKRNYAIGQQMFRDACEIHGIAHD